MTRVGIVGIGHGVFCRRIDATVQELAEMMWRFRIHHMPVVRADRMVGIVSSLDFCRLATEPERKDRKSVFSSSRPGSPRPGPSLPGDNS